MVDAISGESTVQEVLAALKDGRAGLLRYFLETAPLPTFLAAPGGTLVFGNAAFCALFGYSPQECVGLAAEAIVHPDDMEAARQQIDSAFAGTTLRYQGERRFVHKNGDIVWGLASAAVLPGADGTPTYLTVQVIDIDAKKRAEERLQFVNTLLTTEMETSPDAILVVDASMKIISYNRRFADMWRIPVNVLDAGEDGPILAAVLAAQRDQESFIRRVEYLYEHPEEDGHDELETTDGRYIDRHTGVLRTATGEYLGRVWFFRDITERKQAEAQILRSARCDALTGLANRTVFMAGVEHAIAVARRNGTGFAVLFLDLDQFKDVNDTMGHPVGDDLIRAVADRLRANVRASDIVARFGGDEFAVIVCDVDEPIDAAMLAEKIIKAVGENYSIRGNLIRTGVSIGISLFAPDEPDAETMLSRADLALYRAKGEGPGGYRFFTTAMENEVRARVSLETELREAIGAGQLYLAYQPQVEIGSGRITGAEALVRWRHPTRGLISPKIFIPVAERSGFIAELGRWVLREACRQMKLWLEAGIAPDLVAVNLSAVQFKTSFDLEGDIRAALADNGLPASMLELELTETVLMAASGDHNDLLQRFRRDGVRLAIDDFGVGYSSFDYLRRFPVHRIKIAQDFVERITTAYGSAAIVRATIGLCRELGINVIAEGVETAEQHELLQEWGCREAQGYYFARPLEASEVAPLLAAGVIHPGQGQRARSAA